MEDNLKELEEFVNQNKEDGYFGLRAEMIQLIGKLIARNKKLEKCLDEDLGNIINLGILLSEHAEKPKDKNVYVDEVHAFLDTLDFYYIPKSKVIEIIENYYNEHDDTKEEITKFIEKLLQEGDK